MACSASDYSNPAPGDNHEQEDPQKPSYGSVVEGTIDGSAWKFAQGRASVFTRNGHKYLDIRLWNQSFANPCTEKVGSPYQARTYVDLGTGVSTIDPSDPFTLIPTIIFSNLTDRSSYRNNMVADSGRIDITSVDAVKVKGGIEGRFSSWRVGTTDFAGNFEVPFCGTQNGSK